MRILVTGATGKVGQVFLKRFLAEPRHWGITVRALCHNRTLPAQERLEIIKGSIADPAVVAKALDGVTHVMHMATVKEDPVHAMDVSVKGLFQLLEVFRASPTARQFVLIGGDCVVGHCFVPYKSPVTEMSPRRAYPGVYALSKVLEEEMLEQYGIQYGLNWTILRAPWIMEKDDFRYALSFGPEQFGGPDWDDLITPQERADYHAAGNVPILIAADGKALKRNFVHVEDLADAMVRAIELPAAKQQLFNIAMNDAIDYADVAEHLEATRGMKGVEIASPYHSNLLDNAKARHMLGWRPAYGMKELVDSAFDYVRPADDPRKVWYPG